MKSATSVSFQPRNAPIIATIFTSPKPSASFPSARLTASPTPQSARLHATAADERIAEARRRDQAERQPDDDARQRDHVGQDALVQVDHEEHDHRAPPNIRRDTSSSVGPYEPRAGGEHDGRWPARRSDTARDRRPAASAACRRAISQLTTGMFSHARICARRT